MTTINDVAKKAEVSVSTVSKVLRNYPNISELTKNKVLAAIDELGYVPNAMASALSSKNYNRIGIWISINNQRQAIDEINMQYIFGAFSKAKELGLDLIPLFSSMFEDKSESELIRYFKSEGITGLVAFGLNKNLTNMIELINKEMFYCVVVDAPNVNEKTSAVSVDNERGQYAVAKKMMEGTPIKEVLYLAGRRDGYVTESRIQGIRNLQAEEGFNLNIQYANFSEKYARELTFKYAQYVDAIVCASDLMAIGAKNALKELDIYRPVCGFDGITLMGYDGEGMYTVKQDFYAIAQSALTQMSELLKGGSGKQVLLDFEVVQLNYEDIIS